jgi:hypothetical protein
MPRKTKPPSPSAKARVAELERSLAAPLSAKMRAEILERVQSNEKRFAEAAEKYPLPDQTEAALVFRPVRPPRTERRDG